MLPIRFSLASIESSLFTGLCVSAIIHYVIHYMISYMIGLQLLIYQKSHHLIMMVTFRMIIRLINDERLSLELVKDQSFHSIPHMYNIPAIIGAPAQRLACHLVI